MYGYHGKVMLVDVSAREVSWEPLGRDVLLRFIGGIGLGTYLLYKHCPPGVDPLGPHSPLIFVTSPLVGSRLTTSSKFAVLAKSPADRIHRRLAVVQLPGDGAQERGM